MHSGFCCVAVVVVVGVVLGGWCGSGQVRAVVMACLCVCGVDFEI